MAPKTTRWDVADILKTKEAIAAYLDAVLEDGDPELLKDALGAIARSKGMTEIAKEAGLGRSSLYRRTATRSSRRLPASSRRWGSGFPSRASASASAGRRLAAVLPALQ
jgi:probable addiction module antidote protein